VIFFKRCACLLCVAGSTYAAQGVNGTQATHRGARVTLPPPVPLLENTGKSAASYHFVVLNRATLDDKVVALRLAPSIATSVRMPEPVNSVVLGSPECFAVEHSEGESYLVTIRPRKDDACESNLQITTVSGKHALLDLKNIGAAAGSTETIDILLQYGTENTGTFLIDNSMPHTFVAETRSLDPEPSKTSITTKTESVVSPVALTVVQPNTTASPLDTLLARQQRAPLPTLYGQKPGEIPAGKRVMAGVSDVIDNGSQVIVLFSVFNPAGHAMEILPPQVQLGGKVKKKWTIGEQLPISDFRLSGHRLGPHERVDGVALFERPAFKQSSETLFLQIADSGAVDKPALAPIGFGISTIQGGSADVQR